MALNILPSQQPPIPIEVPTEGPCPVWSTTATRREGNKTFEVKVEGLSNRKLVEANEKLLARVAHLESRLHDHCDN